MRSILTILAVSMLAANAAAVTRNVPSGAYPTIQAGVDAALPGDKVQIAAGLYSEDVTVASKTDIRIRGSGIVTIDAGGAGVPLSLSLCQRVIVSGIRVQNSADSDGIVCGFSLDILLDRVAVRNVAKNGMLIGLAGSARVENCTISDVGEDGILVAAGQVAVIDTTIERCGMVGMELSGISVFVENCVIDTTGDDGIQTTVEGCTIVDTKILRAGDDGVQVGAMATGVFLSGNTISLAGSNGIQANAGSTGVVIENNKVKRAVGAGIDLNTPSCQVYANSVKRCNDGIRLLDDADSCVVSRNSSKSNTSDGFDVTGDNNTFSKNTATGNGALDLNDTNGVGTTNAYFGNAFPNKNI